jgi:pimeloyl-ACP methyl ester carboxylesterase
MSGRIYPLNEPSRPAVGHNNLWYEDRQTDQVIVFVHGVLSDSNGCWYRKPSENGPGVYWPDLLVKDRRFTGYSIYLGGYYTSVRATQYEVSDCAEELYTALKRPGEEEGARCVMDRKTIVFVCHSMGGIVVRYLLSARPWVFEDKRIGLVLIASPSAGSPWANRLDLLLKYFKHQQGVELKWGNWNLVDLDGRFRIIVDAKRFRQLFGSEACEQRFIFDAKWLPPLDPVVPRDSAGAYFGRVRMLADTDHFTCVKPNDKDHPGYQFLVDFCEGLSKGETKGLTPTAPQAYSFPAPTPARTVAGYGCQSLRWDVKIDEEGDAYNEMTYKGIVLPPKRPYVFELPPAEVQSGHTTEYELIRDDRTTEGVSLRRGNLVCPTKIEMNVGFANRPTQNNPADFAVSCWDWNVYSMNMEEYRQKPGWSDDGLDYAEKYVPQPWQNFTLLIQFPSQIVFAKRPFFEIYNPGSAEPARNAELTAAYQHCFYYSRALNQAVLSVELPPSPFSYRVSWLLGESRASIASALIPLQRQKQRTFAQRLLLLRRTLEGDKVNKSPEGDELEQGVHSVLAAVAEHVQTMLGDAPDAQLDAAGLEISLMVLDEDQPEKPPMDAREFPVLRIVAGTLLRDTGYRALALFVGDGNAGRAWKRRMARVFDRNEKDPKQHVYVPYVPIPGSPSHSFLISIPLIDPESEALIYGILNFGTFSDDQAALLRTIGASHKVQGITSYAQSYVLKRLMELLKL